MVYETGMRLVDDRGTVYTLGTPLGTGGQGCVFAAEGGRVALKLHTLLNVDAPGSRAHERLRSRLANVMRFPLEGLPIARPLAMLKAPHLGYVMERLTGMMPLARLLEPPRSAVLPWYLETGGLRRRLLLLARAADSLTILHSRGLAYGDLSPNNLFISKQSDGLELRFIDADTLCFESAPSDRPYFTPFYGAPELVTGRSGASTLTDAHAFSILAFELLSLVHPLIGDLVSEGEPALEQAALEGRLPWIDHPDDLRNATGRGIPRPLVLSALMRELANQTFGPGLSNPQARPGLTHWSERLFAAADATLRCRSCQGTFYMSQDLCPWCDDPRPAFVLIQLQRWDADGKELVPLVQSTAAERSVQPVWRRRPAPFLALEEDVPLFLTGRHTGPESGPAAHVPHLELLLSGQRLSVRRVSGGAQDFWLVSPGGRLEPVRDGWRELAIQPGKPSWDLHFGPVSQNHRVARFEYRASHHLSGALR